MSANPQQIACFYCHAIGCRADIYKGGWNLAKNRPFCYVCAGCASKEKKQ